MTCPNCGKRIRKEQTVCPWCGASQGTEKTDGKKVSKKSSEKAPAQVHLSAKGATSRKKLTDKQKKWLIGVGISVGAVLLAIIVTAVTLISSWLGRIQRESELSEGEIAVNSGLPNSEKVQNIALFGLDSRSNNDSGRSDAIIILSIDRVHNKIKLTSIARDSLVAIEGHGQSKITHAWAWGKAKLAVKTLNQNFGMNITDYAYINFFEFTKLIDYLGGVMIDVDAAELNIMNNYYGPELRGLGFNYTNATAGYVRLTGVQALAYSRNRYTGSDIDRGNRQKEVLEAMFTQVKDTPLSKFPSLISQVLEMVHTTLANDELMSIAQWAMTSSPTFVQFSLPSKECNAQGGNWGDGHGWVWHYDMDLATQVLHNFIYEENAQSLGSTSKSRITTSKTAAVGTTTTAVAATTTTAGRTTGSTTVTDSSSTTTVDGDSTTATDEATSTTAMDGDTTTAAAGEDTTTSTDDEDTQTTTSTEASQQTTTTVADNITG